MSGEPPPPFRRLVVGFRDASGPGAGLEAAAQLAERFRAELLGVFVEDLGLVEWSAAPLARRATGPSRPLAPFTAERLAEEFAAAAAVARQRLARVAAARGIGSRFLVERTSAASLQLGAAGPEDLLVVVEPDDPLARLSHPFTTLLGAVARAAAPVLFVPRRVFQRPGPVVAVTRRPEEPAHRIAAAVAGALGEVLIELPGGAPAETARLAHALAPVGERLIVLGRPALAAADPLLFAALAAERRVPTLVAGSAEEPSERA